MLLVGYANSQVGDPRYTDTGIIGHICVIVRPLGVGVLQISIHIYVNLPLVTYSPKRVTHTILITILYGKA